MEPGLINQMANAFSSGPKKPFNVESPSFTPSIQQQQQASKKSTFSSQAASAAPFTPRGVSSKLNNYNMPLSHLTAT